MKSSANPVKPTRPARRDRSGRRTLIVLGIVFLVLLGITLYQSAQPEPEPAPPYQRVYTSFGEADIRAVRLRNPATGATFTITRAASGVWTSPDTPGRVDQTVAGLIARTTVILPYNRTIPVTASTSMAEYGFTPMPTLEISIVLNDGNSHGIVVGDLSPVNEVYYALVDDRPELYPIYRAPIEYLLLQLRTPPVA